MKSEVSFFGLRMDYLLIDDLVHDKNANALVVNMLYVNC